MRKTHVLVLAVVAIALVLAIGAVSAYGSLADDVTPPVTTTDAVAEYWDAATIVATTTDAEGITYIYHELDEGVVRLATIADKPASATITIPTDKDAPLAAGTHELKYWAQDANGNVEAQQTLKFTIKSDTVKPTTRAYVASVVKGRIATLKYKVVDAQPTKGTAAATIKIKHRTGTRTLVTLKCGVVTVNKILSKSFRCGLPRGTYTFYVYATDASGNIQSKVGSNKLTVN